MKLDGYLKSKTILVNFIFINLFKAIKSNWFIPFTNKEIIQH